MENKENAITVRKIVQRTGFCEYCHQARLVNVLEGTSDLDINRITTEECTCEQAAYMHQRKMRMQAAGVWANNSFHESSLQVVLCGIKAVFDAQIDSVTVKMGKNTHKIDIDGDGMIRIKTTFKTQNEETF